LAEDVLYIRDVIQDYSRGERTQHRTGRPGVKLEQEDLVGHELAKLIKEIVHEVMILNDHQYQKLTECERNNAAESFVDEKFVSFVKSLRKEQKDLLVYILSIYTEAAEAQGVDPHPQFIAYYSLAPLMHRYTQDITGRELEKFVHLMTNWKNIFSQI